MALNQLSDLNRYLSSGTIKGINTFLNATRAFENGGYLLIDGLENHFNHEIVSTLIRFYGYGNSFMFLFSFFMSFALMGAGDFFRTVSFALTGAYDSASLEIVSLFLFLSRSGYFGRLR